MNFPQLIRRYQWLKHSWLSQCSSSKKYFNFNFWSNLILGNSKIPLLPTISAPCLIAYHLITFKSPLVWLSLSNHSICFVFFVFQSINSLNFSISNKEINTSLMLIRCVATAPKTPFPSISLWFWVQKFWVFMFYLWKRY